MVESLTTLEDFEKINNEYFVIDFGATWCGPCRMIGPIFEKLGKEYETISFYKVDIEKSQELSQKFNVTGLPTFLFFHNKELVKDLTLMGANQQKLKENLESLKKLETVD